MNLSVATPSISHKAEQTQAGSLERAAEIDARVHAGVPDIGGSPYLLHSLRVMLRLQEPVARIVAVRHDLVEDGGPAWDFERLTREGFADTLSEALRPVTKTDEDKDQPDDSAETQIARHLAFIQRAKAHPIGRLVKLADLENDLDTTRLPQPHSAKDELRLRRYRIARELLLVP